MFQLFSFGRRADRSARTPVLLVGKESLEWWFDGSDDRMFHLEHPIASLRPEEVVESAIAAAAEQGFEPRTCILALAPDVENEALLRLPDLPPAETKEVLERRAVQSLGADPGDVIFHAVPLAEEGGEGESGGRSWLLYLQRRSLVLGLQLELRRRGIEAVRVIESRSAFAARAAEVAAPFAGTERAWLFVGVEKEQTVYGLGLGETLLLQSVLDTGLDGENPDALLALVHELRNLGAWWRKRSAGAALGAIVTIGLDHDLAGSIEPALRAAFGAVDFIHVEEPGSEAMMSRVATLGACRSQHSLLADLTLPLPVRTRGLATAALTTTAICAGVGFLLQHRWANRLDAAENDLLQLRFLGAEASTYQAAVDHLRERERNLEDLASELESLSVRGVPLEALLQRLERTFVHEAQLTTLTVGEGDAGFRVQISARALGEPDRAGDLLAAVEASLGEDGLFVDPPRILPPTALPTSESSTDLLFSVEATLPNRAKPTTEELP